MKKNKFIIEKKIDFCAGHRLMNHKGKCWNIHGHNYVLKIGVSSEQLNDNDMVIDFSEIKAEVKSFIDEYIDHGMILNIKDEKWIKAFKKEGYKIYLTHGDPTAEKIAETIYMEIYNRTEWDIEYISIEETPTSVCKYEDSL